MIFNLFNRAVILKTGVQKIDPGGDTDFVAFYEIYTFFINFMLSKMGKIRPLTK